MAKKFGKLVLFSALAGAAAAGTYYYLQNKKNDSSDDFEDIDDFDDFDEDLDDDIDLTANTANATENKNRSYIDLENVKGKIGEKVIETIDKTKETLDKAKEFIEEQTAPATETVYTQVDLPGTGSKTTAAENTDTETADITTNASTTINPTSSDKENTDTPTVHTTKTVMTSVSATYAADESKESNSENFFDDSYEE